MPALRPPRQSPVIRPSPRRRVQQSRAATRLRLPTPPAFRTPREDRSLCLVAARPFCSNVREEAGLWHRGGDVRLTPAYPRECPTRATHWPPGGLQCQDPYGSSQLLKSVGGNPVTRVRIPPPALPSSPTRLDEPLDDRDREPRRRDMLGRHPATQVRSGPPRPGRGTLAADDEQARRPSLVLLSSVRPSRVPHLMWPSRRRGQ